MKLRIAYLPEEDALARGLLALIESFFKNCKVKHTQNDPVYRHIHIETPRKGK